MEETLWPPINMFLTTVLCLKAIILMFLEILEEEVNVDTMIKKLLFKINLKLEFLLKITLKLLNKLSKTDP